MQSVSQSVGCSVSLVASRIVGLVSLSVVKWGLANFGQKACVYLNDFI